MFAITGSPLVTYGNRQAAAVNEDFGLMVFYFVLRTCLELVALLLENRIVTDDKKAKKLSMPRSVKTRK